jgi:hypothetical protein
MFEEFGNIPKIPEFVSMLTWPFRESGRRPQVTLGERQRTDNPLTLS